MWLNLLEQISITLSIIFVRSSLTSVELIEKKEGIIIISIIIIIIRRQFGSAVVVCGCPSDPPLCFLHTRGHVSLANGRFDQAADWREGCRGRFRAASAHELSYPYGGHGPDLEPDLEGPGGHAAEVLEVHRRPH